MDNNWAAEHLQTIRTLMERSALYRRALAPISTFVGVVGVVAAIIGWGLKIPIAGSFALYWMGIALVAMVGALLMVRRQAVSQGENFWSPPTRRVAQAMLPALLIGLVFGLLTAASAWAVRDEMSPVYILILLWTVLYGLGLHAASFFMTRGTRLFAWGFLIAGLALAALSTLRNDEVINVSPHFVMAVVFGASHLAYGIYLYFTERKNET